MLELNYKHIKLKSIRNQKYKTNSKGKLYGIQKNCC